jgi:hypothetical protein
MSNNRKLEQLIARVENHVECWKQFNRFVEIARSKRMSPEQEHEFLEVKSMIIQELEIILASIEVGSPTKEDIHTLVGNAPSLRFLSDLPEGALRNLESQWHKIYIGWHAILGQLKVRLEQESNKSPLAALLGKKK